MRKFLALVYENLTTKLKADTHIRTLEIPPPRKIIPRHIARYLRSIPIDVSGNNLFYQAPSLGPAQHQPTGKSSTTLQHQASTENTRTCRDETHFSGAQTPQIHLPSNRIFRGWIPSSIRRTYCPFAKVTLCVIQYTPRITQSTVKCDLCS